MEKEDYNEDPVFFCRRCLSLNIREMPYIQGQDYCEDCGAADVGTTSIEEWNKMYEEKHGHPYIVKKVRKWPYWC